MGIDIYMKVKQGNVIQGSAPIWIKKWIKVKYVPGEDEQGD